MHDTGDTLETSNGHSIENSTEMNDTHNAAPRDKPDSTRAVLDIVSRPATPSHPYPSLTPYQSELLELILSRLPAKDLTRALTVSKHWQKSILGSVVLRRNLFLDPDPLREYITSEWNSKDHCIDKITREPRTPRGSFNYPIIELHPFLKTRPGDNGRPLGETMATVCFHDMPCSSLQTVHSSTFLFQPPLKEVIAYHVDEFEEMTGPQRIFSINRTKGVTFGDLLDEMQPKDVDSGNDREENKDSIRINVSAFLTDAPNVKTARAAQLSELGANQIA